MDVRLGVLIEVDIGIGRAGVPPGDGVVVLARLISRHKNLELRGVMGWEGHTTEIRDPAEKVGPSRLQSGCLFQVQND